MCTLHWELTLSDRTLKSSVNVKARVKVHVRMKVGRVHVNLVVRTLTLLDRML